MQSLSFPASVSKRKQACRSCRQRKRRCDGSKPNCSFCQKLGTKCEHNVSASNQVNDFVLPCQLPGSLGPAQSPLPLDFEQDGTFNFVQSPGINFNFPGASLNNTSSERLVYPMHLSDPDPLPAENVFEFEQNITLAGLPSHEVLLELVHHFFEHFYHRFPCFHKASFIEQVRNQHLQLQAPLVLYAICTLSSRYHHDPAIRDQQKSWYEQAKFLYELTKRDPEPALRTIQAVLCLVFHSWTVGDFSAGWLYLGKAWRQAVALSLNRMDGNRDTFYIRAPQWPTNAVEKEEYRRALWVLFIIDRNYTWPTGWPHAIDEKQFKIDIPVSDILFQDMASETAECTTGNTPFTRNLDALIASSPFASEPLNLFHYLAVAHVILGRIGEHIHSLHDSPDSPEYARTATELDAQLLKFRLSLPRSATSIVEASDDTRGFVIWLNITLNTMAILLHHRGKNEQETQEQFARAVIAAKNTVQIIKDTSRISIDLLISAHNSSSIHIAALILVIQWRISGDETLKSDIDLVGLVFDRFIEVYSFLGLKFKLALNYNLENASEEHIVMLQNKGFRGLLSDCSKWTFVQAEMNKLNLGHTMT